MTPAYVELQVTTHFSFLRGASSCDELFTQARAFGLEALGVADRNSFAGIVQAHQASRNTGVRLVVGCRLDLRDGASLLVYPKDRPAYSRLCRLLSLGKQRGGKGRCHLDWQDVALYGEGLIAVLVPDLADEVCTRNVRKVKDLFGDRAYLALTLRRRPNDALRLYELSQLAAQMRVPTVATNDVLFHEPSRRILQDVVTCIRHNCTIDDAGFRRERHADHYLKPPGEMARLFAAYPDAVARTREIMQRCTFSLDELSYQYPDERNHPDVPPQVTLEKFVQAGAVERYPKGVPPKVVEQIGKELNLIERLNYASYFLTVHAIVKFARSQGILCQGRGSAANSAVCFVLGITAVNPMEHRLLFERFISENRNEPPDIDVDFEHARRELVMQWVFDTYGRDHAALCSTVIRYRAKGALRDVGKALGLPEDLVKTLSQQFRHWATEVDTQRFEGLNLNLSDRRLVLACELARQLIDTPRHLSQHPGGFVLTRDRLDELVPIEPAAMKDRQVIEWDKDDIDILKFMKVDCLALGMMTCMKKSFELLGEHKGITKVNGAAIELADIPQADVATYDMICKADTIGVFQIESRAQMSMLPRLKPRVFYDLAIEVAIVRPGPIQGDMVHPFLRRRNGDEAEDYPNDDVREILGRTHGVPLFQEHAMRVAVICAGFTADEADHVRRSLATFKRTGGVDAFREKMFKGMIERKYEPAFAERLIKQLEGFGSYGFPESHAISFAMIAYASSWMKCHHPDVFCAALLNSQPMGFYSPSQLVRDAINHGVEVRPVCVNASRWDCTLEATGKPGKLAVRLGLRMVKGLANVLGAKLAVISDAAPFRSIDDAWRRSGLPVSALVTLAEADAFLPAMGKPRREALWALKGLRDTPLPLFDALSTPEINEPVVTLRPMTAGHEVVEDYDHVGLSLRGHPLGFLRGDLFERGIRTCKEANALADKSHVLVAGMVLVRQRPGTAAGVTFMTIEDETATVNVVIWSSLYEEQRRLILTARMVAISGQVQKEGEVIHVVARRLIDLSDDLDTVGAREDSFPVPKSRGDEFRNGEPGIDHRSLPRRGSRAAATPVIVIKTRDFK